EGLPRRPGARRPGMLSPERLAQMAAGASTLAERIAGDVLLEPGPTDASARRMARWAEQTARSDPARFRTRLAMDGVDAARATLVLGRPRPRPGASLPEWARLVDEALAAAARIGAVPVDRALVPDDPLPLEDLSLAFVRAARVRLERRAPAAAAAVAPA